MGDNSVKALKHLGLSEKTPFIKFQNQEIAAIFDPPHLLKFTHNLFLKHDVANVEYVITRNGKRLTSATKWEAYCRCMKLTDVLCIACCSKSLKPCTHSAKTVSLPVPIISSSYQHSCHSKDNCILRVE